MVTPGLSTRWTVLTLLPTSHQPCREAIPGGNLLETRGLMLFPTSQTGARGHRQFVNTGIRAISGDAGSLPINSRQLLFISPAGGRRAALPQAPSAPSWRGGQPGRTRRGRSRRGWAGPRAHPSSPAPPWVTLSQSLSLSLPATRRGSSDRLCGVSRLSAPFLQNNTPPPAPPCADTFAQN